MPDFLVCPTPPNGVGHCFVNKGAISGSIGSSPSHKNRAHRRSAAVGAGGYVNEMIFGGFAAWHITVYVGFLQIKTCILLKTCILRGDSPPTAYTLNLFKQKRPTAVLLPLAVSFMRKKFCRDTAD